MKIKTIIIISLFMATLSATGQKLTGTWGEWQFLIGEWISEGYGRPGQGTGTFSFKPDLDGNILVRKSHTDFPVTNSRPAFNHDDLLIVYQNNTGIASKAIYFDNENHTINYIVTYTDNSIILTSEAIKSVPRFRLTYQKLDDKQVNVRFEMTSEQNPEEFKLYLEGKSVKK